jgi:Holliday junction DNA helicase RuvA
MIHYLKGTIVSKTTSDTVVECSGVGFYVMIPSSVYPQLPEPGGTATVYTHLNVKEDGLDLYGFYSERQQAAFRMLTGVSGVGPKAALSILSLMSGDQVALAIAAGDHAAFTACQGVGPKLAQRIVLELKDRAGDIGSFGPQGAAQPSFAPGDARSEAVSALAALGFSQSEAAAAVARLPGGGVEDLVAGALREMGGRK